MTARKIYLASSWRNPNQPRAVEILRAAGHSVYDFRHPKPDNPGFSWGDIAADWLNWSPHEYIIGLNHNRAKTGFELDKEALDWCDTCVLLLPCGRSAHLEAGYAIGKGKQTFIVLDEDKFEPELMYMLALCIVSHFDGLLAALDAIPDTCPMLAPSNEGNNAA
jgi:nucleoside 2-deoxyribosyltransferase